MPIGTGGFLAGLKTLTTGASAPRSTAGGRSSALGGTINAPFSVGRGSSAGMPNVLWVVAGGLAVWWFMKRKRRR